jgi:hypothetical protein
MVETFSADPIHYGTIMGRDRIHLHPTTPPPFQAGDEVERVELSQYPGVVFKVVSPKHDHFIPPFAVGSVNQSWYTFEGKAEGVSTVDETGEISVDEQGRVVAIDIGRIVDPRERVRVLFVPNVA